jgi:predicted dehydrogenase
VGGSLRLSMIGGGEENIVTEGSTGSGASIMDFPHDAHRAVLTDFLDAIEEDRDPVVTGEEALATQRLIADIMTAAAGTHDRAY